MKTKLTIFITLIATTFLFAEDFWMKLNFSESCKKMFYSSQDEIYISKKESPSYAYRSLDKGQTWERYPIVLDYPFFVNAVEHISDDGNYLYMYGNDTLRVTHKDSANFKSFFKISWNKMVKIKKFYFFCGTHILMKADENLNDTTIVMKKYVGEGFNTVISDSAGTIYTGSINYTAPDGGLYRSHDDGDTWIGPGPDLLGDFISSMAVDSQGRIFVGTSGHSTLGTGRIYRSEDNGSSWEKVVYEYIFVSDILINSKDDIFAGLVSGGMIYSKDHGDTWNYINEGLSGCGEVNDIAISPDGYVYLATDGGVYRSINSTGIENSGELLITNYKLEQNYPNPFNSETKISFSLISMAFIELLVFNSKGELVENIVSRKLEKGNHSFSFKAGNLHSGVYFYRLSVNDQNYETRKMLYLR